MRFIPNTHDSVMSRLKKGPDCWEWIGTTTSVGYGSVSFNGKKKLVHRLSYEFHKGVIPKGLHVCHACDNRKCANPDHLWLGTHSDNMTDMSMKKRQRRGSSHPRAKHNEVVVAEIRRLAADGASQKSIAQSTGVPRATVSYIVRGVFWRNVENANV